ncbi:YecA family protein [soil metagenome]
MTGLSKRLCDLDDALMTLGENAMILSQLDGYLAGIMVCPDLILPSEWLPGLWGAGEEPDDSEETDRLVALIVAHGNDVLDTLRRRPDRYAPIFDVYSPSEEVAWEVWVEGFEAAMRLRPKAWAPLIEEEGEAGAALSLLLALWEIASGDVDPALDEAQVDELALLAPDIIPGCVGTLAIRRFGPSASRAKVGRNDPCPCGSGQKYKKCCGAN